jgi:ParB-like chromosome segregation protein Spo0J
MISTVKITEVKANPNNPRTIKDEKFKKLVESIKGFPQMLSLRPIVVNDDMVVLGGNMRLKACKEAGLKEVPIIKARELTNEQQKEFIIKDNVGFGDWDWDTLSNEWDVEQLQDWGLDIPNFKTSELDDLSEQIQPSFRIEVLCKDEEHQEKTYNKLIADGHECKLLTL